MCVPLLFRVEGIYYVSCDIQISVSIHEAFETMQTLVQCRTREEPVLVWWKDGEIRVEPLYITAEDSHKVCLKFSVSRDIVHGQVYMFKKTNTRGPIFIHESAKHALAAPGDTECVCARLRVSSGNGSVSISKTVYRYIFHTDVEPIQERPVLKEIQNQHDTSVDTFKKCVQALKKIEGNAQHLVEDIVYLAYMLNIREDAWKTYCCEIVERHHKNGGDMQRVIDVHTRATRISTLIQMFQT